MLGIGVGIGVTLMAGMSGPFSPASLFASGEKGLWFDPSNFATMWQDAAGTTPVTAVGQQVGRIIDLSPNGVVATQVTSTARPSLQWDGLGHYYLAFDGVDDFLVTGSIDFTATSQVTMWAGMMKTSDATFAMLMELSVSANANARAFYLAASTGGATVSMGSRGSGALVTATHTGVAAPTTLVLTGSGDILAPLINMSVNGDAGVSVATTQGTGTYMNGPVYIGMRGGASLPFAGSLYSAIIRGAASSGGQISNTNTYVNGKTGAY